jgi:c(7)-type cytochrome triheme protein
MQKHVVGRQRFYMLALVLAGSLVALMAMPQVSQAFKLPKDFTMTETGSMPAVVFSHEKHVGEQKLKCNNCHTKLFQMRKGKTEKKAGKLTMEAMQQGKFCGACHNGERAFTVKSPDNCVKCHVKK